MNPHDYPDDILEAFRRLDRLFADLAARMRADLDAQRGYRSRPSITDALEQQRDVRKRGREEEK